MNIAPAFTIELERLRQHIEHGLPYEVGPDATPALLLYAAMRMGRLSLYRGSRMAGALSALTHKGECYARADAVAQALNLALEMRLDVGRRSG